MAAGIGEEHALERIGQGVDEPWLRGRIEALHSRRADMGAAGEHEPGEQPRGEGLTSHRSSFGGGAATTTRRRWVKPKPAQLGQRYTGVEQRELTEAERGCA
jgi:hypothetical protein